MSDMHPLMRQRIAQLSRDSGRPAAQTVESETIHERQAAAAQERGAVFMVKSLVTPYSVPYPEFIREVEREHGAVPVEAWTALRAIERHAAEAHRDPALS